MFESAFQSHQYQKPRYTTKLNLVALMDIFTILVFFLLLNTGEAEKLENAKFIKLPDSHAGTPPHGDLVVMIGEEAIWLGEDLVVKLDEVTSGDESSIEPLSTALADYRDRLGELNSYEQEHGLPLTIMGDRTAPYGLLKTVMATARLENFRNISLAVNQVATPAPVGTEATQEPALADTSSAGK